MQEVCIICFIGGDMMPSKKVLDAKRKVVEEMVEKLKTSVSGILVDYRGITVEQDTELRNKLRQAGIEYKVIKNSLTRFAVEEAGFQDLNEFLTGPSSLALSFDDPVAPAKIISSFAKGNDKVEIKSGFIEGKIIDLKQIKELADLPSKEMLVAKALAGFNAPISGFVNVLNANIRGLAVALNAIAEQKAQAG
jgi:large subunit ribosomal protein L10